MSIFLTGGSGYLGQATIRALRSRGHDVVALARSDRAAETVTALGADVVRGELTELDVLRAAAADAEGAIHLAMHPGADVAAVDLAAALAMLDGLGDRPYVHTGGVWVYGDTDGVVDEDAPQRPPAITAWRAATERAVLDRASSGARPVLVMPGLVYGGRTGPVEALVAAPAREAGVVHYIGDGANHWALVHVDDIADLYARALDAAPGARYAGVGSVQPTYREIAEAVATALDRPGHTMSVTLAQARTMLGPVADAIALDQRMTAARARRELGWNPPQRDPLAELAAR
jgi:nucleoside-diphosphate-sugar epimerase